MPDPTAFTAAHAARSHVSWGLEIGRVRIAVTRTREVDGEAAAVPARVPSAGVGAFASGALAGVGAVALLVVGASAATRTAEPVRYMVSLPVPAAAAPRRAVMAPRAPVRRPHARKAAVADDGFDAADAPYVDRAMATGAFQEWEDSLGQRRFLTAGPARAEGGRSCRAMALLVRLAEGGSRVRSAERCVAGPVDDAPAVETETREE